MNNTINYNCLTQNVYTEASYTLVPLRHQDIFDIMKWRNEQMIILRQNELLTKEGQEIYFKEHILPTFSNKHPKQILFSYLLENTCIGYGGLVYIDWASCHAEVSFLLDTQRAVDNIQYHKDFSTYLKLLKQVAFKDLNFHRLYTETFDIRPKHISVLEEQGFLFEGRMKEHVFIEGKYIDSLLHGCINHG